MSSACCPALPLGPMGLSLTIFCLSLTKLKSLLINIVFKDNLVISYISNYLNKNETPIICYKI